MPRASEKRPGPTFTKKFNAAAYCEAVFQVESSSKKFGFLQRLLNQLPEPWEITADDQQRPFFWNPDTGTSSWDHPCTETFRMLVKSFDNIAATHRDLRQTKIDAELQVYHVRMEEQLEGWRHVPKDPPYFYHDRTKETRWDDPRISVLSELNIVIEALADIDDEASTVVPESEEITAETLELLNDIEGDKEPTGAVAAPTTASATSSVDQNAEHDGQNAEQNVEHDREHNTVAGLIDDVQNAEHDAGAVGVENPVAGLINESGQNTVQDVRGGAPDTAKSGAPPSSAQDLDHVSPSIDATQGRASGSEPTADGQGSEDRALDPAQVHPVPHSLSDRQDAISAQDRVDAQGTIMQYPAQVTHDPTDADAGVDAIMSPHEKETYPSSKPSVEDLAAETALPISGNHVPEMPMTPCRAPTRVLPVKAEIPPPIPTDPESLPVYSWMVPEAYLMHLGLESSVEECVRILRPVMLLDLPLPWVSKLDEHRLYFVHRGRMDDSISWRHPMERFFCNLLAAFQSYVAGDDVKRCLLDLLESGGFEEEFGEWQWSENNKMYEDGNGSARTDDVLESAKSEVLVRLHALKLMWDPCCGTHFPIPVQEWHHYTRERVKSVVKKPPPAILSAVVPLVIQSLTCIYTKAIIRARDSSTKLPISFDPCLTLRTRPCTPESQTDANLQRLEPEEEVFTEIESQKLIEDVYQSMESLLMLEVEEYTRTMVNDAVSHAIRLSQSVVLKETLQISRLQLPDAKPLIPLAFVERWRTRPEFTVDPMRILARYLLTKLYAGAPTTPAPTHTVASLVRQKWVEPEIPEGTSRKPWADLVVPSFPMTALGRLIDIDDGSNSDEDDGMPIRKRNHRVLPPHENISGYLARGNSPSDDRVPRYVAVDVGNNLTPRVPSRAHSLQCSARRAQDIPDSPRSARLSTQLLRPRKWSRASILHWLSQTKDGQEAFQAMAEGKSFATEEQYEVYCVNMNFPFVREAFSVLVGTDDVLSPDSQLQAIRKQEDEQNMDLVYAELLFDVCREEAAQCVDYALKVCVSDALRDAMRPSLPLPSPQFFAELKAKVDALDSPKRISILSPHFLPSPRISDLDVCEAPVEFPVFKKVTPAERNAFMVVYHRMSPQEQDSFRRSILGRRASSPGRSRSDSSRQSPKSKSNTASSHPRRGGKKDKKESKRSPERSTDNFRKTFCSDSARGRSYDAFGVFLQYMTPKEKEVLQDRLADGLGMVLDDFLVHEVTREQRKIEEVEFRKSLPPECRKIVKSKVFQTYAQVLRTKSSSQVGIKPRPRAVASRLVDIDAGRSARERQSRTQRAVGGDDLYPAEDIVASLPPEKHRHEPELSVVVDRTGCDSDQEVEMGCDAAEDIQTPLPLKPVAADHGAHAQPNIRPSSAGTNCSSSKLAQRPLSALGFQIMQEAQQQAQQPQESAIQVLKKISLECHAQTPKGKRKLRRKLPPESDSAHSMKWRNIQDARQLDAISRTQYPELHQMKKELVATTGVTRAKGDIRVGVSRASDGNVDELTRIFQESLASHSMVCDSAQKKKRKRRRSREKTCE